jgi:hypothetical protein
MAFAFEKLVVYQKAVTSADRICELTGGFRRGYWFLADQLNRDCLCTNCRNLKEARL